MEYTVYHLHNSVFRCRYVYV